MYLSVKIKSFYQAIAKTCHMEKFMSYVTCGVNIDFIEPSILGPSKNIVTK